MDENQRNWADAGTDAHHMGLSTFACKYGGLTSVICLQQELV